ncbi:MAG: radical SAM/SPASM family putative metalloenzyme maturase, partial [Deltaproteobacteria bacterium]
MGIPIKENIAKLVVETTTLCNLQCPMCVKQSATLAEGEESADGSMSLKTFQQLECVFPSLESLVLNGIGEPLLNPLLPNFISISAKKMPKGSRIGFQSNGVLFNEQNSLELLSAGANTICISIDSIKDEQLSAMRGVSVASLDKTFSHLTNARQKLMVQDVRFGIEIVLTKNNIIEMPQISQWAIDRGASFILVSQLMPYSKESFKDVAYDTNTDIAIEIYNKWITEAQQKGIDFTRYYATFMKFSKNEQDSQLLSIAKGMIAEAEARGAYLHLGNLLRRNEEYFQKVDEVFEKTQKICKKHDVEIKLPTITPHNVRRCEFVEDKSLFVSFNGKVHPCYFLWHRFNCYVGGVENKIKPWSLGSINNNNILEIWNSDEYKKF